MRNLISIGVVITPQNLVLLKQQAIDSNVALTWYLLEKLGLSPEVGVDGRRRTYPGSVTTKFHRRNTTHLPLKLSPGESAVLNERVAASGMTRSAYVHQKLGIEPRPRGRPGHY